jgi:hypothetical protein
VTEPRIDHEAPLDLRLNLGRFGMDPHKIIYGTIMLMTAYALYNEGDSPLDRGPLIELIGVSFAPLFALAMAHAFSEAIDFQIRYARQLTWVDRRHLMGENLKFLLIAIPPIIIMTILTILRWDANDIIRLLLILGLLSLAFWGGYAARKAGLGRGRQALYCVNYGLMGLFVIVVELLITH